MVLNHDLQMFAAMNRIDRTTGHAMRVGARPTGSGDKVVIEPLPRPEQARDRNSVSRGAMPLDTSPGAGVAPGAIIKIQNQNALTFIEALFDILIQNTVTHGRAVESRDRLLDQPAPKDAELSHHLETVGSR